MHKGSSRGHRKYADPLPGCPLTDPGVVYYFSIDEVNSLRFLEDMSLRTWVYLAKLITFQPSHGTTCVQTDGYNPLTQILQMAISWSLLKNGKWSWPQGQLKCAGFDIHFGYIGQTGCDKKSWGDSWEEARPATYTIGCGWSSSSSSSSSSEDI